MATIPQQRRRSFHLSIVLIVANLALLNLVALSHFRRLDLTRDRVYTLHPATLALLNRLDDLVTMRVYLSERIFREHEAYAYMPREIRDQLAEFAAAAEGRIVIEYRDPSGDEDVKREAAAARLTELEIVSQRQQSREQFRVFCGIVLAYGGKEQLIQNAYTDRLELDLALAITRLTQRETITIGFNKVSVLPPGLNPQDAQRYGIQPDLYDFGGAYQRLKLYLQQVYGEDGIEEVPTAAEVPPHIDVLVVANTEGLDDLHRFHIDQYLMKGGKVVLLSDGIDVDPRTRTPTARSPANDEFFANYGITIDKNLVLDDQRFSYDYRYPLLLPKNFDAKGTLIAGVAQFFLRFASSIRLNPPPDVRAQVLARSSNLAWQQQGFFTAIDDEIKPPTRVDDYQQFDMVGMLRGNFSSYFARRKIPDGVQASAGPTRAELEAMRQEQQSDDPADDSAAPDVDASDEVVDDSPADAEEEDEEEAADDDEQGFGGPGVARGLFIRERAMNDATLVVIGNARFLMNDVLGLSGNLDFFATILDRLTTGGALSAVRQRTSDAPAIRADLSATQMGAIKYGGMLGMPILVALIGLLVFVLRRRRPAREAASA